MALLSINKISLISLFKFVATQRNHLKKDMVLLSINKINKFSSFVQKQIIFCGYSKEPSPKDMVLLSINKINKLFFFFKTYFEGTQKNLVKNMVLLSINKIS